MSSAYNEELRLVVEQAAEWLQLLPAATQQEHENFLAWLLASPLHVREFLAAIMLDDELRHVDSERLIDVAALAKSAQQRDLHSESFLLLRLNMTRSRPLWSRHIGML